MEDAATAEISRSQVWQWVRHGRASTTAARSRASSCATIEAEELERIRAEIADDEWFERRAARTSRARLFDASRWADDFLQFLTLPAYAELDD